MAGNRHEFKERLFNEQNGRCYYCKRHMKLVDRRGKNRPSNKNKFSDDECTLEHLIHSYDRKPGERTVIVAACHLCNNTRGNRRHLEECKKNGTNYRCQASERQQNH